MLTNISEEQWLTITRLHGVTSQKTVMFRLGTLESTMKQMSCGTSEYDTAITSDHIHMCFLKLVYKQGHPLHKTLALKTFLVPSQVLNQLSYSASRLPQCCQLAYSMNLILTQHYMNRHAKLSKQSGSCSRMPLSHLPDTHLA
jgi:hypothetical protein